MKAKTPTNANLEAHARWKLSAAQIGFDLYTMKESLKKRDLMRQAARNDKKQRVMLGSDYE